MSTTLRLVDDTPPEHIGPEEALERSRMTAAELSWSLRATNRAAAEVDRALAEHLSLRPIEYDAFDHVMSNDHDPIGPVELASRLGISAGSATELVDRLERRGHVHRERGTTDRRRVLVTASPDAVRQVLDDLDPLFAALDQIAESRSPEERAIIQSYLRQAASALSAYAASIAPNQ